MPAFLAARLDAELAGGPEGGRLSYLVSIVIPALVGALIGLVAAWLLGVPLHSFRPDLRSRLIGALRKWLPLAGQGAPPGQPAAAGDGAGAQGAVEETLSARLYRLDAAFAPTTHTAAHPRDLAENKDFLEAVDLLKADGVSLDTVLQYALGANWGLACAALAALKERPDGGQRRRRDRGGLRQAVCRGPCISRSSTSSRPSSARRSERRWPAPSSGGATTSSSPCCFATTSSSASAWAMPRSFGTAPHATANEPIKFFLGRVHHPYAAALVEELGGSAARQRRPCLPHLVRPLLGREQGHQCADRAGRLEGGARRRRGRRPWRRRRARSW